MYFRSIMYTAPCSTLLLPYHSTARYSHFLLILFIYLNELTITDFINMIVILTSTFTKIDAFNLATFFTDDRQYVWLFFFFFHWQGAKVVGG